MKELLGEQYLSFRASLATPPPVSIRINPLKHSQITSVRSVPWCESGRYLDQRPSFTLDPHFHAGAYYVQEASSMFLEQAVRQSVDIKQPLRVLDLCAAPGGKSTHLLSLISSDSLLVSNEAIRSRATVLSENIQKWGYSNVVVTNNDPSAFANVPGFFDLVVVDAPCSGEGLFRKDTEAISEWSPDSVALCASRQRRIVEDVWPSLKDNGILIYCTCTYNDSENENNLKWLRSRHDIEFIRLEVETPGVLEVLKDQCVGYHFFPHLLQGEGFFISVMRKLEAPDSPPAGRKMKGQLNKAKDISRWLTGEFVTLDRQDLLIAIPAASSADIQTLSQRLNVVTQGVALGTTKHGKFVPEHSLSLSANLNKKEFQIIDLDLEQALQYLRKDNLTISPHAKGMSLVQYEGNPLGWANVLETRINNLYPSGWRIKNL